MRKGLALLLLACMLAGCTGTAVQVQPETDPEMSLLPEADFSTAQWIAAPLSVTDTPDDGDLSYVIETTITIPGESAVIAFGYHPSDHRMYRLMMERGEGAEEVRCILETAGGAEESFHVDLETPRQLNEWWNDTPLTFRLEIMDGFLYVTVNDELFWDEIPLPEARDAQCGVGYYCWREDVFYVDRLRVTDPDGSVLLDEDFSVQKEETLYNGVVEHMDDGAMIATAMLRLFYAETYENAGAPCFLKTFQIEKEKLQSAVLHMSALGIYEVWINGQPVTDMWFAPGNIPYHLRMYYQSFDVSDLLVDGDNRIEVRLGHGWYDGATFQTVGGLVWGRRNAILCEMQMTGTDGTRELLVSDADWSVSTQSPVIYDDIWQGVIYDARITPVYEHKAEVISPFANEVPMERQSDPPVRVYEERLPVEVRRTERGTWIYDFGQEITGVCRVSVQGTAGSRITLRHAEWLNDEKMTNADGPAGSLFTWNLLGAQNTDMYILEGTAQEEVFCPTLTFHGFRYMELEVEGNVTVGEVEALALSSDMTPSGSLVTSDERINRLHENIIRSIRGNFLSIPMDCPQRTERYGWTGDAQLIQLTASYLFDTRSFYAGYEQDILDVQDPVTGRAPDMAPRNFGTDENGRGGQGGANGWGDAIVLIPWRQYLQYGDKDIIENAYDGMSAWIGYLVEHSDHFLRPDEGYGDHLAGGNPHALINTAWSAHVCDLMQRMALVMERPDDAQRFGTYFEGFRDAFLRHFVTQDAVTGDGAQTGYVLGLAFDLYPEEMRDRAAANLVTSLSWTGEIVPAVGFAGAAYLLPVLCDAGYTEIAYQILESEQAGAWLYQVAHGATTIWELWDCVRFAEDNTYEVVGSLNHVALGSVGAWMYAYMAGIRPDENAPGYRHFFFQPAIGGTITKVDATYHSVSGDITVSWERTGDTVHYTMTVPDGCTATFIPPGGSSGAQEQQLSPGTHSVEFTLR